MFEAISTFAVFRAFSTPAGTVTGDMTSTADPALAGRTIDVVGAH